MKKQLTDKEMGFIQGYTCCITTMMYLNNVDRNGVDTLMREMWQANKCTISKLQKAGVDENDIAIIKKHWKELNK